MHDDRAAPAWRRLLAFGVDYLVIAAYGGLLAGVGFGARRLLGRGFAMPATPRARLVGHAVAFAALTVPVVLYFAWWEASAGGGTPGKRALGLRVVAEAGGRVPLGRALARAAVKFAPWELAHTALWDTPGWPVDPRPTGRDWAGYGLSLALSGWYVVALFVGSRRTPYDRVSGTRVVRDP
ncbi:MAG TPA: RDD family protein [Thermomicrobiales bacterium]|nr:RDD family protein [Thermomicrobiales bacterium]